MKHAAAGRAWWRHVALLVVVAGLVGVDAPVASARPRVQGECLLLAEGDELPPSCHEDAGFPAISADGTLIATLERADEEVDVPALWIQIRDAETARHVRTLEVFAGGYGYDDKIPARVRTRVLRRAAVAQRVLDAGGYRPMHALGGPDLPDGRDPKRLYADVDGELVRVIHPGTGRVVWQHRFSTPPWRKPDPDADCGGRGALQRTDVWWDPATSITLVRQTYDDGCMCGFTTIDYLVRMR